MRWLELSNTDAAAARRTFDDGLAAFPNLALMIFTEPSAMFSVRSLYGISV
jgi:hypothetical protein